MKPMLLASLLVFTTLFACKSASPKKTSSNPSRLNGTWQLNYIASAPDNFGEIYPDKIPRIAFDAASAHVNGNTGCNSFAGPVTINGNKLAFDQTLVTTKMFCPGAGESNFLEALKKVESWSVKDGVLLELTAGNEIMMRFIKVQ